VQASHLVSPGHLTWSRGLFASQSAHHFMYISLSHGHLSPGHYTSQYILQHTSSPAPNCLHIGALFTHILLKNCFEGLAPDRISIMCSSYVAFAADFLAEAVLWSCNDCQYLNVAPSLDGDFSIRSVCSTATQDVCPEHRSPCACMV